MKPEFFPDRFTALPQENNWLFHVSGSKFEHKPWEAAALNTVTGGIFPKIRFYSIGPAPPHPPELLQALREFAHALDRCRWHVKRGDRLAAQDRGGLALEYLRRALERGNPPRCKSGAGSPGPMDAEE